MSPRLLIFHPTIAPYRIDFFNELSQAFDTRVCLHYKNMRSQRFNYETIASQFRFNPVYLPILFTVKDRVINSGQWKHLDEFNPDIVLVCEYGWDCMSVLLHRRLKRKKYKVVSICDDSYNMVAENNDFSYIHKMLRHKIVPRLDELILVEPKATEWYRENFGKGIFFPIIKPETKARDIYKRLLPLSKKTVEEYHLNGKFVFLFVGRLVTLKNVETTIKAFANLKNKDSALVIIGDGPERSKLEQIASETDANIIFTGRLEGDALYKWYNIANVFVLASYQESFGAVTNEALLAGCKGIISCKAGSRCLIEEGINGYTFTPTNVEELTEKMELTMTEVTLSNDCTELRETQMKIKYEDCMIELIKKLGK